MVVKGRMKMVVTDGRDHGVVTAVMIQMVVIMVVGRSWMVVIVEMMQMVVMGGR